MRIFNFFPFVLILPTSISFANECFCLVDEDDNLRHSCVSQLQGIRKVFHCRDDAGDPISMNDLAGWRKLADGEPRCQPCKQPIKGKEGGGVGPIRGNGGKQEDGGS